MTSSAEEAAAVAVVAVFDLDYTLWPFWADTHVQAPFRPLVGTPPAGRRFVGDAGWLDREGRMLVDAAGRPLAVYRDTRPVLHALRQRRPEVVVAAVSRTECPATAKKLLQGFGLAALFDDVIFDTGPKTVAAARLEAKYKPRGGRGAMVLFDDEYRNIRDAEVFGMVAVQVDESRGISLAKVLQVVDRLCNNA